MCDPSPNFMMAPAPKVFSIWLSALFKAFCSADTATLPSVAPCRLATAIAPSNTYLDYVRKNSNVASRMVLGQGKDPDFSPSKRARLRGS